MDAIQNEVNEFYKKYQTIPDDVIMDIVQKHESELHQYTESIELDHPGVSGRITVNLDTTSYINGMPSEVFYGFSRVPYSEGMRVYRSYDTLADEERDLVELERVIVDEEEEQYCG